MDEFITKASNQAMSFAIRSGISLASGYAIKTVSKMIEKIPELEKEKINEKITRLKLSIGILNLAIDLIRTLNIYGTMTGCDDLIEELSKRFAQFDDLIQKAPSTQMVKQLNQQLDTLIMAIDRIIPLLNLSISTNNMVNKNINKISINNLIDASNYILSGNLAIGPIFDLKYYSMFYNSQNEENPIIWKENFARSEVRIISTGPYDYSLVITENFDDDRFHEGEPQVVEIKLLDIQKLFFTKSGKLLKLENYSAPVFIIKYNDQYLAFGNEVTMGDSNSSDSASESESESDDESESDNESEDESNYKDTEDRKLEPNTETVKKAEDLKKSSSLTLLEYLIRLLILQTNEQKLISLISDDKILLYLNNEIPHRQNHDLTSNIKRLENLKI